MKKPESSDRQNYFWKKIPIIRFALKRLDFYRSTERILKSHFYDYEFKDPANTLPPQSENIELHCTWITEAYGPSNIEGLLKALTKLNWDEPENTFSRKESLTEWIKQARKNSSSSFWINGGVIHSQRDKNRFFGGDSRYAELPEGVDFARLSLCNVTSSLTLVTVQFVFSDDAAASMNQLFRDASRTKVKYRPSILNAKTATFEEPVKQKRQAINEKLSKHHAKLSSWFTTNIPGYFASLKTDSFPTVDLITSRLYEQPNEGASHLNDRYVDLMFNYGVEAWKCTTDPNLEFRLPGHLSEQPVATLFGNYDKLTLDINSYGGKNRAAFTSKLHMYFDMTMSLWATHNLLLRYEQQLSDIRDKATTQTRRTRKAIRNLKDIQRRFLSISTDIQAVSNDVGTLVKTDRRYLPNVLDFNPPQYLNTLYPNFVELNRLRDQVTTARLIELESRVNLTITASGNLISTIANLRIQRNLFWLTLATVTISVLGVDSISAHMQDWLAQFSELIEIFLRRF